jgi:hypothetical protein
MARRRRRREGAGRGGEGRGGEGREGKGAVRGRVGKRQQAGLV